MKPEELIPVYWMSEAFKVAAESHHTRRPQYAETPVSSAGLNLWGTVRDKLASWKPASMQPEQITN